MAKVPDGVTVLDCAVLTFSCSVEGVGVAVTVLGGDWIGLSSLEMESEPELGFLLEGPSLPNRPLTLPFSPSFPVCSGAETSGLLSEDKENAFWCVEVEMEEGGEDKFASPDSEGGVRDAMTRWKRCLSCKLGHKMTVVSKVE